MTETEKTQDDARAERDAAHRELERIKGDYVALGATYHELKAQDERHRQCLRAVEDRANANAAECGRLRAECERTHLRNVALVQEVDGRRTELAAMTCAAGPPPQPPPAVPGSTTVPLTRRSDAGRAAYVDFEGRWSAAVEDARAARIECDRLRVELAAAAKPATLPLDDADMGRLVVIARAAYVPPVGPAFASPWPAVIRAVVGAIAAPLPVPPVGWRCPTCGGGLAPTQARCPCVPYIPATCGNIYDPRTLPGCQEEHLQ